MPANNNHPSQQNVSNVIFEQIPTVTAGNNLNYNFSYHGRNKLFLLSFLFTTSATAANRLVHIVCGKSFLNFIFLLHHQNKPQIIQRCIILVLATRIILKQLRTHIMDHCLMAIYSFFLTY